MVFGCCCDSNDKSGLILKLISTAIAGVGVIILGLGVYVYITTSDSLDNFDLGKPALVTLIMGGALLLLGAIGFYGVIRDSKEVVMVFCTGVLLVSLGTLICGIALLAYTKYLDSVADLSISNSLEEKIITYELAVYQDCCPANFTEPQLCSVQVGQPCYAVESEFLEFLDIIGDTTCGLFESADLTSKEDPTVCGSIEDFVAAASEYIKQNMIYVGAMDVAFSAILAVMAVYAGTNFKETEAKNEKLDEKEDIEVVSVPESEAPKSEVKKAKPKRRMRFKGVSIKLRSPKKHVMMKDDLKLTRPDSAFNDNYDMTREEHLQVMGYDRVTNLNREELSRRQLAEITGRDSPSGEYFEDITEEMWEEFEREGKETAGFKTDNDDDYEHGDDIQ